MGQAGQAYARHALTEEEPPGRTLRISREQVAEALLSFTRTQVYLCAIVAYVLFSQSV
jgi:hypothetical protein